MKHFICILILLFVGDSFSSIAQEVEKELVSETFSSIHIVNGHSTETLKKRQFRYIIGHRFGDALGDVGGVQTAYGFDNAADIRFGFDIGLTDNLLLGIARLKGISAPYRSILEGFAKYRFLSQTKDNNMPISLALTTTMYGTYMKADADASLITHFPKFTHRFAYGSQLTIARKFHPRLSVALLPTYVHRNYVRSNDQNGVFATGGAVNLKLSKTIGVVAEYFHSFAQEGMREDYTNSLGFALEFLTNGHVFSINVTNARGFGELQYVALNTANWNEGQFRIGFSITRTFKY